MFRECESTKRLNRKLLTKIMRDSIMYRTGVVRDNRYLDHKTGIHHIEVPQRLEVIYHMLDKS